MNCEQCGENTTIILDEWERGEPVSSQLLAESRRHIVECRRCRRKYRALLTMVGRDIDAEPSGLSGARKSAPPGFSEEVMRRITRSAGKTPAPCRPPRSKVLRDGLLAAAAFAAATVLGLVLWKFGVFGSGDTVTVRFALAAPDASTGALPAESDPALVATPNDLAQPPYEITPGEAALPGFGR